MAENDEILERLQRLENGIKARPPAHVTLATLPAPPPLGEMASEKYKHDRILIERRKAEAARGEELARIERERTAAEVEARRVANAPKVAKIDAKIADVRSKMRPIEEKLNTLDREVRRLNAQRHELV